MSHDVLRMRIDSRKVLALPWFGQGKRLQSSGGGAVQLLLVMLHHPRNASLSTLLSPSKPKSKLKPELGIKLSITLRLLGKKRKSFIERSFNSLGEFWVFYFSTASCHLLAIFSLTVAWLCGLFINFTTQLKNPCSKNKIFTEYWCQCLLESSDIRTRWDFSVMVSAEGQGIYDWVAFVEQSL